MNPIILSITLIWTCIGIINLLEDKQISKIEYGCMWALAVISMFMLSFPS